MNILTTEDTGFPAPFTIGSKLFYTLEHVKKKQYDLRLETNKEEEDIEPPAPVKSMRKRVSSGGFRQKEKNKTLRTCQRCGKEYFGNKKSLLCGPECKLASTKEANARYLKRKREKEHEVQASI